MKVTKEEFIGVTYDELLAFNDELLAENEHMRLKDMAVMGELQEENELLQEENAKLRKYVAWLEKWALDHASFGLSADVQFELDMKRRDLGVEVDG